MKPRKADPHSEAAETSTKSLEEIAKSLEKIAKSSAQTTTPSARTMDNERPNPRMVGAVEDAVTYPILTQETTPSTSRTATTDGGASGPGGSTTQIAQDTMRRLLGWRYRTDDPKGFMAALNKAFRLKQVEDHTEWDVVPQSYTVQADMGEITGAQASIYARAKAAVDLCLPLLDGLTALRPDADMADVEAMRSIVRPELTGLVTEFSQPGGPRVQRVDNLFKLLIGAHPNYRDPEFTKGHLGQLADRLGLQRKWINTVADEQNLTNFLIMVDYVNSLFQTWDAQKRFFTRGGQAEPFLGTQLVLLSQALESVADSVNSAFDAMDSVLIGDAERQTVELRFFGESFLTVSELMGWIQDFSQQEGPQLLQDGGKDGVVAFRNTINRLHYLMFLTVHLSKSGQGGLIHGFRTFRVLRALQELKQFLGLTQTEADRIRRREPEDLPSLSALNRPLLLTGPLEIRSTAPLTITVAGQNIQSGAIIRLISMKNLLVGFDGIVPTPVPPEATPASHGVTTDGAFITAQFVATNAKQVVNAPQDFALVVINPDGQHAWIEDIAQALTSAGESLTPAGAISGGIGDVPTPTVTSASATRLHDGAGWKVTVRGTNFEPECTCTMPDIGKHPLTPENVKPTHFEVVVTEGLVTPPITINKIIVTNGPPGSQVSSKNQKLKKSVTLR